MQWSDLDARARGLATRLLGRARLESLARAADLPAAAAELARLGLVPLAAGGASPSLLEEGLRRTAAARLLVLARWSGDRESALALLYEEEDRRSLRALLRGAAAGTPPEMRLAGLIPTPALPEKALRELARQPTPAAVAVLLVAWGNPYGPPLLAEAERPHPELFALESALGQVFTERLLRAARRGGWELKTWVRETIELESSLAVLLLAEDRAEAARHLGHTFRGTPFAAAFEGDSSELETEILGIRLRALAAAARRRPLGPAPFLLYLLRLRAELLDLRKVLWGIALGVPRERLARELVTP